MNWFYVENGQQSGPVEDAAFEELVRSGRVDPGTLVWHEGMANWQPCREVAPESLRNALATAPAAGPAAAAAAPAGNEAVCAECGGIFNMQDMIPYENFHVCAKCKPILMQKLAEGAKLNTGALNYAGFWTRFAAVFLDGILLQIVNVGLTLAAGEPLVYTAGGAQPRIGAGFFILLFVRVGIALAYEVVMIGKYGATLGKMACKIRVVRPDGSRISYLRALGRYFAKMLSAMICLIGYIMAGFDKEKRALHDYICDTRVVMK